MQPGAVPQTLTVPLRRYWCRYCHAVLQVVPRGVLPHKHFAAAALVLALFLFGLQGLPVAQVRQQITLRQVAQRVATTAMSFAPPGTWGLSPPERAFYGGAQMA